MVTYSQPSSFFKPSSYPNTSFFGFGRVSEKIETVDFSLEPSRKMSKTMIMPAMPTLKRQLNEDTWFLHEGILDDMQLPSGMWMRVALHYSTMIDRTTVFALQKMDGVFVRKTFEFDGYIKPEHFVKPVW